MKKIFLLFFTSLICFYGFSAGKVSENYAMIYQDALSCFEKKDYGKALKLCEDAILSRKQKISKEISILEDAMEPHEVQMAGDKLYDVNAVLLKRDEYEAVNLLNYYCKKKGEDFFDNSVSRILSYLESLKVFPEAQKLLGDIYKIEGEYQFAEQYYRDALKNSQALDIPDQRYEILYLLAELSELEGNPEEKELRLLSILTEDKVYLDNALVKSIVRCVNQNKKDSMEKFFNLYRADNYFMMNAYYSLAEYYREHDECEKALSFSALHVITGFTKIVEIIEKRNINFEYQGLGSVLFEASLYPDIIQWGVDNKLWQGLNMLGEIANMNDDYLFARSLFIVLSEFSPEEYYRKAAVLQIKNP